MSSLPLRLPDHLQRAVWRAHGQAASAAVVVPSGHTPLDQVLPGGGWPCHALTEILQAQAAVGEWQLLAPVLGQVVRPESPLLLLAPPHEPCLLGLQQLGIAADQVIRVETRSLAEGLWSLEQALQANCLGAVMAWLPQVRVDQVRRLQAAAHQHAGPAFLLRHLRAADQPSAAPLRLKLHWGEPPHPLHIELFKCRGQAAEQKLELPLWPPALARVLPAALPPRRTSWHLSRPAEQPLSTEVSHGALDRAVARLVAP